MDFPLSDDIDSDILNCWDEDENDNNGGDDQEINDSNDEANLTTSQEENLLANSVARSASTSHESNNNNANNYFTASTFADQSMNNMSSASNMSMPGNLMNMMGSSSASGARKTNVGTQNFTDRHNIEPLFPPNYFSSIPWDPSQAVMNPQAKAKPQHGSAPNDVDSHDSSDSKSDRKVAAQYPSNNQHQQNQEQGEQWATAQAPNHIMIHHNHSHNNNANHDPNQVAAVAAAAAAAHFVGPEQNSVQSSRQGSRQTITDASTNTGSSFSSGPSASSRGNGNNLKSSNTATRTRTSNGNNNNNREHEAQGQNRIQNQGDQAPPFYLFSAPCELRQNFLQAQQQNEVAAPGFQDANAFHYGMAVNGFNPHTIGQVNPIIPASLGAAILPNGERVTLLDGRRDHKRKTAVRNEREQQRAQKITELIEKLRSTMEQGGWKVEMKSKYQILSTSSAYLKHLIKSTKEKELNLQRAKAELAIRNQKLEEDRVLQDSRSDPESVTSSLTAFSYSDSKFKGSTKSNDDSSTNVAVASVGREGFKRKNYCQEIAEEQDHPKKCQKTTADDDSNHDGSNHSSGHEDSGNSGSGVDGKNISIGKMSSSLSDITDSNRGSSDGQAGSGSSGSNPVKAAFDLSLLAQEDNNSDSKTDSSISSTAAVVSGVGSNEHDHRDTAIIFTQSRKRKQREKTSMEDGFQLSYQEVFLASNVPQLIATPAGRIVACNDFFFRVTGLTPKDVKKITIFSMVQVDQLSTLFDLVAESLRKSNNTIVTTSGSSSSSNQASGSGSGSGGATSSLTSSNQASGSGSGSGSGFGSASDSSKKESSLSSKKESSTSNETPSTQICFKESGPSSNDVKNLGDIKSECRFETATLPCVPFPQGLLNSKNNEAKKKLFMNVTFMYDENPSKRCIHCALTDKPGCDGNIGTITPELLSMIFPYGCATKAPSSKKFRKTKGRA